MQVKQLNNAVQVKDIDLNKDDDIAELGKLIAHECVVLVDKANITERRLFDIHTEHWGSASRALIHKYVGEQRISGRHWRKLLLNLSYIANDEDMKEGMTRVSFKLNDKGKPTGIFTNGELDWHSDQQSTYDNQRVIGLMALDGTKNSQTTFLCTAPAYETLDHEDKTMVDELITVWNWDGGKMGGDLIDDQQEIVRYNMTPLPNMQCPLVDQTCTGRKGIKFPSHCFSHFSGMTVEDSQKFKQHLWDKYLNKDEYIYTQDWEDGQIVFMDQNITLHARPTNVTAGSTRTMSRIITYMDKLYPGQGQKEEVMYEGKLYNHEEFAKLVDDQRKREFEAALAA